MDLDPAAPGGIYWTQTSPSYAITSGYHISGSITGPALTNSEVNIKAVTSSGREANANSSLFGGSGTYSLSGIPPGDTVLINAYVLDKSTPTPTLVTGLDLGQLAPINADTTQNLNFPTPPIGHFGASGS